MSAKQRMQGASFLFHPVLSSQSLDHDALEGDVLSGKSSMGGVQYVVEETGYASVDCGSETAAGNNKGT